MEKTLRIVTTLAEVSRIWYWSIQDHWSLFIDATSQTKEGKSGHPYHMHFTSSEDNIKAGHYFIQDGKVFRSLGIERLPDNIERIVASTDPTLELPGIGEGFLKLWVNEKVNKVTVHYPDLDDEEEHGIPVQDYTLKPLLNENGTIKIAYHPNKESYKDVFKRALRILNDMSDEELDKFIKTHDV